MAELPGRRRELAEWIPGYRRQTWIDALVTCGLEGDPDQLAAVFPDARRAQYRLYPDALPVLESLAADYPLGLVTNGPADVQRGKVDCLGIAQFFRAIVISGELSIGKPSTAPYERALAALRVEPAEAVMIGDNPHQ